MLTETFIASSSTPPTLTSSTNANLKDAGIFAHTYQPQPALKSTYKKSATNQNCLAVNSSHVFAAQREKAVVHVYSRRENGNQEATIPFPERVCSIALAASGSILILGLLSGGILLWELGTGRIVATRQAHLQAVDVVAVDLNSNFLLSGSKDSTVLVWSLHDLLSFTRTSGFGDDGCKPRHTLSAHKSAVTALAVGHSITVSNIAVSASKDQTAVVWNYYSGQMLRTFLLPGAPLCMTLDPADRAFFLGYEDGSVQCVNFFESASSSFAASMHDLSLASTPVQPPRSSHWMHTSVSDTGSALAIALNFDGTKVLTGHQTGKILAWDVSNGRVAGNVADYAGAPITNLLFLRPCGLSQKDDQQRKISKLVKPRQHEEFSGANGGSLTASYTLTTNVLTINSLLHAQTDFNVLLDSTGFDAAVLDESRADLLGINALTHVNNRTEESDFMALDEESNASSKENELLKGRIAHLEKLQHESFDTIARLTQEKKILQEREKMADHRRVDELRRRQTLAEKEWEDH